jgi:hypothetical protein
VECFDWRKAEESTCANRVSLHKNSNENKGGQLLVVLRLHISVALQQKMANFKVAPTSRVMQWSLFTEVKQKNELAQTQFRFIKTITMQGRRQLLGVLHIHISVALQQKTANFKVAIGSRVMQWSLLTEVKQKNHLAA